MSAPGIGELAQQEAFHLSSMASIVMDRDLTIVAVNAAYDDATGNRDDLVGAYLFEAFPPNPDRPDVDGVDRLRASLATVERTRRRHHMVVQRYDIPGRDGRFEERWWSPVNTPIVRDGRLVGFLHQVDDITELAEDGLRVLECARDLLERLPDEPGARSDLRHGVKQFTTAVARQAALVSELAQLRRALTNRAAIDMAKGLVMAERRCSPDEAFAVLTELANNSHIRVSEVAAALVYQAQEPGVAILPEHLG